MRKSLIRFCVTVLVAVIGVPPALAQQCVAPPPLDRADVTAVRYEIDAIFIGPTVVPEGHINVHSCLGQGVERWDGKKGVTVSESTPRNLHIHEAGYNAIRFEAFFYVTNTNAQGARTGGRIDVPSNIEDMAGGAPNPIKCGRIAKLITHETGHLFGLSDFPFNSGIFSVMTQGDGSGSIIDGHPEEPTACDAEAIEHARQFRPPPGPLPPAGNVGGPGMCNGPNEWSDDHGCCHGTPNLFVQGLGQWNRKPVSHIYSPLNGGNFISNASIPLTVHTMDLDGAVVRVDWGYRKDGGAWQYSAPLFNWPFSMNVNLAPGSYEIRADAYDTADQYTISQSVNIVVAPPPSAASTLASGAALFVGQYRMSANGLYYLIYQSDGNLVLYGPGGVPIVWTATGGPPYGAYMNPSGALEVYNAYVQLLWSSNTGTPGNGGSYVWVTDTGKVALVRPNGTIVGQWP